MSRVKIKFPEHNPLFSCRIAVRIGDINYGNHLGNDAVLTIIHEARVQMLTSWNYTELNAGGNSLIMGDVMIAYKGESFYGDILDIPIYSDEITERSFDLLYNITTIRNDSVIQIAHAKTAMVCFDYEERKIAAIKTALKTKLEGVEF